MGQFKPMVKMMTTEPSAILKLKKGGKVEKKADGGFMPMQSTMPAGLPARGGVAPAASPARPSLAARRRAMNPNLLMKKGGAASGEKIDKAETKTTIEGGAGKFAKTKMDTSKKDKASGTGSIKEGAKAGYKSGGIIKTVTNKTTKMVDGDKTDKASGTKGIKEGQPAGFRKGGKVPGLSGKTVEGNEGKFTNNNVDDGEKFDPAHGTKGVRESNAGGFKKGGSTKKAYAAGGNVVDDGKAVKMPPRIKHAPVANTMQSGTFKKGGKVKKYADGDSVEDLSGGAYDRAVKEAPMGMGFAKKAQGFIDKIFTPKAGAVTKTKESVTVSPAGKKRGGKC